MANLDVALRLRLLNGLKPGAQEAKRDLDSVRTSAHRLNATRGGDRLARDLGRVVTAGSRADASLRQLAANGGRLSATGTAAARLGTSLNGVVTAGSQAGATLRKLGSERAGLAGTAAVAKALAQDIDRAGSAATRTATSLGRLGSERARIAGTAAVAAELARNLERAASVVPRIRLPDKPVRLWGEPAAERAKDERSAGRVLTKNTSISPIMAGGNRLVGGLAGGIGLSSAYKQAAAFDRRITMIGQTAEASRAQIDTLGASVHDLAQETALPVDKLAGGLEALVAQGRNLKEAMDFLPSVGRTAAASGSEVDDIAKSADSVGSNFDIAGKRMQAAFDIMAAGGKAGQFELKDMARYLPSLSPAAKAQGFKGEQGLADIVAMLQTIRKGSGTAEEAAVSMTNIFQKLNSEETAKNFKKMGVDLEEALKKGRKEGRNLVEVLEEATQQATKGDLSLMPKLFKDQEFGRGMLALMTYRGEWQKLSESLQTRSGGTVLRDLVQVTKDAQASIDRVSNSWSRFIDAASRAADAGGLSTGLSEAAKEFQSIAVALERVNKAYAEGGLKGAFNQATGDASERIRENRKAWLDDRERQETGRIAELEADNRAFHDKLLREGRSSDEIASTMRVREEAVEKARRRKGQVERAKADPALAERKPLRMGVDPTAPLSGEVKPVGIGTVAFNEAYPLDLRRAVKVPLPPVRPRTLPVKPGAGIDRIEDVLGPEEGRPAGERQPSFDTPDVEGRRPDMEAAMRALAEARRDREPLVKAAPERIAPLSFELKGPAPAIGPDGGGRRPDMEAAMRALAETRRIRDQLATASRQRTAPQNFDLKGPAPTTDLRIGRQPGAATSFPLSPNLAAPKFDAQPIITAVKQAEDATRGLQTSLKQDLSGPAAASMQSYQGALSTGVQAAIALVVAAAAQMKSALSFTATPTITPSITAPRAAPSSGSDAPAAASPARATGGSQTAPRLQSAGLRQRGGINVNGPIHVHGVRDVASLEGGIRREADRRARDTRDNGLHDLGSNLA